MTIIEFSPLVYVVLGIDENQDDQVLSIQSCYEGAKRYCIDKLSTDNYFDVWIEKHPINMF